MKGPNEAQKLISGRLDINVLLACALGVIFLSAMIVMAIHYPNPDSFQLKVFTTTLALAAGGFGAIIPGSLTIRHKNLLRAGGAMALVILVLFLNQK